MSDADSDPRETVSLGDLSTLSEGEMKACRAGRFEVLVCRVEGTLHAIEDLCSHAESTLTEGLLEGHIVTCPLHFASFDVRDGTHLGPPAFTGVRGFAIRESQDGATVDIPAPKESSGLPPGMFRTR